MKLDADTSSAREISYIDGNSRSWLKPTSKDLQRSREEISAQIEALGHHLKLRSDEVKSLEEQREHHEGILRSHEESIKRKILEELMALKIEKPELLARLGK